MRESIFFLRWERGFLFFRVRSSRGELNKKGKRGGREKIGRAEVTCSNNTQVLVLLFFPPLFYNVLFIFYILLSSV